MMPCLRDYQDLQYRLPDLSCVLSFVHHPHTIPISGQYRSNQSELGHVLQATTSMPRGVLHPHSPTQPHAPGIMETLPQYLRRQLCLPPATIIQQLSEHMTAESKLLSDHRAADSTFLAQHIGDQSRVLNEHATAHSNLLAAQIAAQARILTEQTNAHAVFVAEQVSALSRILAEQAGVHAKLVAEQASAHSQMVAEHVKAQTRQLAEHVSSQAQRITEPVDAHAAMLDKYLDTREVLLSKFTGVLYRREPGANYLEFLSSVGYSVKEAILAEEQVPILLAISIMLMRYVFPVLSRLHCCGDEVDPSSFIIGTYFGSRICCPSRTQPQ